MDLLYKTQTRFLFHSHIKVKIPAAYPDTIFDGLFAVLENVDRKYNSYQAGSYIDRINCHAGSFVDVDDETIRILEEVITLSHFFDGVYDITIMPLIRLWGFYKDNPRRRPTPHEIATACHLIDYKNIEIRGNQVKIGKGQEIITGSFIKAYATDRLAEKIQENGIDNAIINAGGSTIRAINSTPDSAWQVSVFRPENEEHLFTLNLDNHCYSTSSQSTTFVDIDGQRYGHILNPKTGLPSTNQLLGITSENSMIGDIVSTGLFNEPPEVFLKKMTLLSQHYTVSGFMMDRDSIITSTPELANILA